MLRRILSVAALLAATYDVSSQIYPDTMWIPVTFYDFHSNGSCPEFEQSHQSGVYLGMVDSSLDSEGKPVMGPRVNFNAYIKYWYRGWSDSAQGDNTAPSYSDRGRIYNGPIDVGHDTSFINVVIRDSLPFLHIGGGVYQFSRTGSGGEPQFFWIDGRGFGNEGRSHNYSFAMELDWTFTKKPGLTFDFNGDDDVWVFVDDRLAMDLGGIHSPANKSFSVDAIPGLVDGQEYDFKLFYAERHTTQSTIRITTNIVSTHIVSEVTIEADPDSAVIQAGDTVDFTGWVWYDSTGDDGVTHHLRDTALSNKITWTFSPDPNDPTTLLTSDTGSQTSFTSTLAYDTFTVTATFEDPETGTIVSETMTIRIIPAAAHHLVIESAYDTSLWSRSMLQNDQPLDTLRIPASATNASAYAILRDLYGNFTGWSQVTAWQITAGAGTVVASVNGQNNAVGRGTATKVGRSGVGEISATDSNLGFSDLVAVRVSNNPPVANDDNYATLEDQPLSTGGASGNPGVLANDVDGDAGTVLTASVVTSVSQGVLTFNGDGSFQYVPAMDFNGSVTFTYRVTDGQYADTATVTILVGSDNDLPVAVADAYSTTEDVPVAATAAAGILANDSDPDGDVLTARLVRGVDPAQGTLSLSANGAFTFTPAANFHGLVTFTYQAFDGSLSSNVTTVSITVTSVNDVPLAADDSYTTNEDGALAVGAANGVLANDVDNDRDPLTVNRVSDVSNGTLILDPTGSFSYTPAPNFAGTDQFRYRVTDGAGADTATVTIIVNALNDAPVAAADNYYVNEDDSLIVSVANGVLKNDSDVDGPSMTAVIVDPIGASEGTLTFSADGSFRYLPPANFSGTVTFTYQATDGQANSPKAMVVIFVQPVNDKPIANNDAYQTLEDAALNVGAGPGVLANDNDADGDVLTATILTGIDVAQGTLSFNGDGSFLYTPTANYTGWFTFTYVVSDGNLGTPLYDTATATISVGEDNDPPVAVDDSFTVAEDASLARTSATGVAANDSDPNGDPFSVRLVEGIGASQGVLVLNADGSLSYTPPANYHGTVTFRYQINDGRLNSDIATAKIVVSSVNDVPVAANDQYSTDEDKSLSIPAPGAPGVLANDNDLDGDALTAVLVTGINATQGTLDLRASGSFVYTPALDYSGTVTFTYRASDGTASSNVATVTIVVNAVNDAPVLSSIPDQDTTKGSRFRSFDLDDYVVDADHGDALLSWTAGGGNIVRVSINASTHVASVTVSDSLWDGTEQIVFTVSDPAGLSRSDTVSFAIRELGTLPRPTTDTVPGTYTRNWHKMNLVVSGYAQAKIHYTFTLDGSVPAAPTVSSKSLTGSGLIDFGSFTKDSSRVRVQAYASLYPYENSPVRSFEYLIVFPHLPSVVGTPGPGTYDVTSQEVSLGVPGHADAVIVYTTDGTDPASSRTAKTYVAGTPVQLGPFTDVTTVQIRARATKAGYKASTSTLSYEFNPQALPRPTANPPGHVFRVDTVWVTLTVAGTDSVVIRYSTDGNPPNENSNIYTGPIAITDSTVLKAVAYKEGNLPGPVMTEVYVKSIPSVLEIYPSLSAREAYPATVACSAGVSLPLVARVFDQRDSSLSEYARATAPVTWTLVEIEGQDPGRLTGTTGYSTSFLPEKAYTTVKVVATFEEGGVTLRDEVTLIIAPGRPYQLWLEADHDRQVSPNAPNEIDTVKLSSTQTVAQIYAIVRDSLGNYVAPSQSTLWLPSSGDIATVGAKRTTLGEGEVVKGRRGGVVTVSGEETDLSLRYPTDSLTVVILQYSYDSLQIVVGTGISSAVDSVVMNTNQDTTILVLGHRDDGGGWEAVNAKWEILDAPLGYRVSAPPSSAGSWTLSPTDTASGRIRVTLGEDSLTAPDTAWVQFTPGPPTRVEFEVLTPADSLIAGAPITTVVRLYNDDNKLVRGTWCHPGGLSVAVYDDVLGDGGRPEPTVTVDDSTYTMADEGASVDECIAVTGIDTVGFVLYYAPLGRDTSHVLRVNFGGGLTASTAPFLLLPGPLDSLAVEQLGGSVVDSVLLHMGESVTLVAIGYDAYGNRRGRENSDWSTTDSLHAIARPANTPQVFYTTVGVTDNESGYIVATAKDPDGRLVRDSVWVNVVGPKSQLLYSVTRDANGNGLLDGIELHFDKAVSFEDLDLNTVLKVEYVSRSLSSGVVTFVIDSVVAAGGSSSDTVFTVYLRERSEFGVPQTSWQPSVSVTGVPDANNVSSQKATDGAGPVVWRVVRYVNSAGDPTRDRVTVVLSEPVTGGSKGEPFGASTLPSEVFNVWVDSGNGLVAVDGFFSGITGFQEISASGDTLVFQMTNGNELTGDHHVSLSREDGRIADNSPQYNLPVSGNVPVRVIVRGAIGTLVVGPNPIKPIFFFPPNEGDLVAREPSEAYGWARSKGGAVVVAQFILPSGETPRNVHVEGSMMVFDAVGNLVYSRVNNRDVIPHDRWDTDWVPGTSRQLVFYWNGITDRNRAAAAGVYRVVVYLRYLDKEEKYINNVGIGR